MSEFENAVGEFGRRLGMRSLSVDGSGTVDLHFGDLGRLFLETAEAWALVTLERPLPEQGGGICARLLEACHWRRNHPWDIHPGMAGEGAMTLTARVPLMEFTAQVVEDLIDRLSAMLDSVENAEHAGKSEQVKG
jgi:type III secretion system chaperone SycN